MRQFNIRFAFYVDVLFAESADCYIIKMYGGRITPVWEEKEVNKK